MQTATGPLLPDPNIMVQSGLAVKPHDTGGTPVPAMLTTAEVAKQLGISRNTVYDWIKEGRLPAHRYGPRTIRINADDLTALTQRVAT